MLQSPCSPYILLQERHELGCLSHAPLLRVASHQQMWAILVNGAITLEAVQVLRHVPDLLADSVTVHHLHISPGGAGELIHNATSNPP